MSTALLPAQPQRHDRSYSHVDWRHRRLAQSLSLPHGLDAGQLGAQAGGAHRPLVQSCDPHSSGDTHGLPSGHAGTHIVSSQRPFTQTSPLQSLLAPQGAPGGQNGEQAGSAHVWLGPQTWEAQSEAEPQGAPWAQSGAQALAMQMPATQRADAQSALVLHGMPSLQSGEHAGPVH